MNIAIVDYGLGNLFSVENACLLAGHQPKITQDPTEILKGEALILPGVGAFSDAMDSLRKNDLISVLIDFAQSGKPFLGICLGMQLMFSESEEFGTHKGLGLIDGRITRFPKHDSNNKKVVVPQTQWNAIYPANQPWENTPFKDLSSGEYMHFVHSYYAQPADLATVFSFTVYGGVEYPSSVKHDNLLGIQFHPEKSGLMGLSIYKNWK